MFDKLEEPVHRRMLHSNSLATYRYMTNNRIQCKAIIASLSRSSSGDWQDKQCTCVQAVLKVMSFNLLGLQLHGQQVTLWIATAWPASYEPTKEAQKLGMSLASYTQAWHIVCSAPICVHEFKHSKQSPLCYTSAARIFPHKPVESNLKSQSCAFDLYVVCRAMSCFFYTRYVYYLLYTCAHAYM